MDEVLLRYVYLAVIAVLLGAFAIAVWTLADRVGAEPRKSSKRWQSVLWAFSILLIVLGTLVALAAAFQGILISIEHPEWALLAASQELMVAGFVGVLVLALRRESTRSNPGPAEPPQSVLGVSTRGSPVLPVWGGFILLCFSAIALLLTFSATSMSGEVTDPLMMMSVAVTQGLFLAVCGLLVEAALYINRTGIAVSAGDAKLLRRLLRGLAILTGLLCALALSVFGLLLVFAYIVITISTIGGRRRAAQLSTLWTVAHIVRSGQPMEAELDLHAQLSRGSARRWLLKIKDAVASGAPLSQALCRAGIVTRTDYLELAAAEASGALNSALPAIVQRQSEQLARQSNPGMPRFQAGYFGILLAVLLAVLSFIGSAIVPKFRKIIYDFTSDPASRPYEMPEITKWLFAVYDHWWSFPLAMLLMLASVATGAIVEVLVDYYGWETALQRLRMLVFPGRPRTSDLLRGLRWGVIRKVPLNQVIAAMAETSLSFQQRSRLNQVQLKLEQGSDLWDSLVATRCLSRDDASLLRSAQVAGNLPWALNVLSDAITARETHRYDTALQLLHPVTIVLAGTIVAVTAIGLLLPIFKLMEHEI